MEGCDGGAASLEEWGACLLSASHCKHVMGFTVHVDRLRSPKCASMMPVGVNREILGTQTALHGEYSASVCVCWGILLVRKTMGPGPAQAGGLLVPPAPCAAHLRAASTLQAGQGQAEASLELGLWWWLEDSCGVDGSR